MVWSLPIGLRNTARGKELADKACVSRTTIVGLESGAIRTTTTDTLLKLSNALNEDVPNIFFTKIV